MIIFPAMDLLDGKVVKLESEHHRDPEKIYGTVDDICEKWMSQGAEWLHVIDLNAALGIRVPNHLSLLRLLPMAAKHKCRIQWGGGIRDFTTLQLLLDAELGESGAKIDRAIVGTRAVTDLRWLEQCAEEYPDRIVVAVDAVGFDVVVGGWQEKSGINVLDFVAQAEDVPIAGFLYTNVAVEGRGEGVQWDPIRKVIEASPKPVIFSGGITTSDEVKQLEQLGAYGVIIGSALYMGKIDFNSETKIRRKPPEKSKAKPKGKKKK